MKVQEPFMKYLKKRLRTNQDYTVAFIGDKGSGKSWSALKLGEVIAEELGNDFGMDNIVFRAEDFVEKVKEAKPGKGEIIMFDEMQRGMSSRDWYKKINKALVHCIELMRTKNIILIITTHSLMRIDKNIRNLMDFGFEMTRVIKRRGVAKAKPFILRFKPKKGTMYYNYIETEEGEDIKRVEFKKPSKELREKYQEKRNKLAKKVFEDLDFKKEEEAFNSKERARELLNKYGLNHFKSDWTGKVSVKAVKANTNLSQGDSKEVQYWIKKLGKKEE